MSTQIWPPVDDFADGASAYGTGVRRYLRVRPSNSSADIAGVGGNSLSIDPADYGGELRRYWFNGSTEPTPGSVEYGAGFHDYSGTPTANTVSAVVERQTYIADGEVMITPKVHSIGSSSGAQDHLIQHCVGVCGRVQGGTLTIPPSATAVEEYIDRPDGYYFIQVRGLSLTAEPELVLYRVTGGTWTRLAGAYLSDHEDYRWGVMDGGAPRRMRMVIENQSGNPRIKCYRVRKNSGPGAPGGSSAPVERLVFNHLDTGAAAITAAGRWGTIGCQLADQFGSAGSYRGIVLIANLRIRNAAGTTVHLRDYWHRTTTWVGHVNNDDASTQAIKSRTLSMAYSGDMCGPYEADIASGTDHSAAAHVAHLIADSGNDRLVLGVDPEIAYPSGGIPTFSQSVGWYFSQDPAQSSDQHRSVTITFPSTVTSPRESRVFGLHLRASLSPHSSSFLIGKGGYINSPGDDSPDSNTDGYKPGYRATVSYEHASGTTDTFTVKVWAHAWIGASVLLATADVTATLALGTEFKLGLEVHNFDFGFGASDVGVMVRLNDTDITLTPEAISGITIESGWLVDRRTLAVNEGLTVGMYGNIHPDHLASGLIYINEFATEALTPSIGPHTPPLAINDGTAVGAGANNGEIFVNPGGSVDIAVTANDIAYDGATVDVTSVTLNFQPQASGGATHGSSTVDGVTGVVTYNCPAGSTESGVYWRYRFEDSLGTPSSNTGLIRVSIVAGTPPDAQDDTATVVSGSSVTIPVLTNDTPLGGASWQSPNPVAIISQPSNATASADAAGEVTFTSNSSAPAQDETFTYQATDSNGLLSNIATVTVTVTAGGGDTPPTAVDDTATVDSNASVDIPVLDNDATGTFNIDPASVVLTGQPVFGTAVVYTSGANVGQVEYTAPLTASNVTDTFRYTVDDIDSPPNTSNAAACTVWVAGYGGITPPTANPDSATVAVGSSVVFSLTDNDTVPGDDWVIDTTSVVITTAPVNGSVTVDPSGTATFVSGASDPAGTETFEYTVRATNNLVSSPGLVTITVSSSHTNPTANQDNATVPSGATTVIDVVSNDVAYGANIDPTTVAIVSSPTSGTVDSIDPATGAITYTATDTEIDITDSFTYEVDDDAAPPLTSAPGTVFITVLGSATPPQNPVAGNDYAQIVSGQSVLMSILANDQAFQGATLDQTSVTLDTSSLNNASATYSSATGLLTFTSDTNAPAGIESLSYTVEDSNGWISNTAVVTVVITDGGPPPASDQDTVEIDAETVAKTGTLTIPASWPIQEERVVGVYESRFDTGHASTIPALPKHRRIFEIRMGGATSAERETMSAFFLSRRGTEVPFDWVHPLTNETIAVRFVSANTVSRHVSGVGAGVEDYRFSLVEVFGASTYGGSSA